VRLTSETISIRRGVGWQDLGVCSCTSAADSNICVCVGVCVCVCDAFDFGLQFMQQTFRVARRTSHATSQAPHFRCPPFLFIARTVSHNAQQHVNMSRLLAVSRGMNLTFCQSNPSLTRLVCVWFLLNTHTHTHIYTRTRTHTSRLN